MSDETAIESSVPTRIEHIPKTLRSKLRDQFYLRDESEESIRGRTGLSRLQLQRILSEPDDLEDFRAHRFNVTIRKIDNVVQRILDSDMDQGIEDASLQQKSSALKGLLDVEQRLYDAQTLRNSGVDDFTLARLLSMDRNDAREFLAERVRDLVKVLYAGIPKEEVLHQLGLAADANLSAFPSGGEVPAAEYETLEYTDSAGHHELKMRLVNGGLDGNERSGHSGNAQRTGAFRGIKKR